MRTDFNMMFSRDKGWPGNACRWWLLFIFYCCLTISAKAQVHKYPATINPVLGQPYSMFLNDYSTPGTNNLLANIVFNDFNEPSWNFRLRIKIESSRLRMETIRDYRPSSPITLAPGVLRTFSGADWEDYFDYNHLTISGLSVSDLIASGGKLPEGFYSFCFQVLDYDTGDPLSEEVCRTAWIKLMDPPRVNMPLCGNSLDPLLIQHPFSWQMFDAVSPNTTEATNFQLTVWEITERGASIQTAVSNGQALQIFQSPLTKQPTYLYGPADPPLELGKQYIYRVQAIDPQGRDKFKNQGYSEFCTFFYGWPIGGKITLKFPSEGGGFRKKDIPSVSWSAVDAQLPGQQVGYEIKIAPMEDGQTKEQAILNNEPWYYYNTPPTSTTYNRSQQMDEKQLKVMTKYAWQVKAFTGEQEVGKSDVSYFNGPSLMENFWAGVHRVAVDYLDGSNLDDISGEGRIRLKPDADAWTPIKFEHIRLKNQGDFYVMDGGEFYYDPSDYSIELTASLEQNGKAYFDVKRFRINKDGIYAEGAVRWPFPLASLSSQVAYVKSDDLLANYNDFLINTAASISAGNKFKLLEPFGFTLNLNQSGLIYIYNNQYRLDLNGSVELPDKIKGAVPGVVQFPFASADQLFYIEQDNPGNDHTIAPLAKADFEVAARKYILDLSEEQSPDKFAQNLLWKGIYIQDFDLRLFESMDTKGQFDLASISSHTLSQPVTNETDAWVTSQGLNLKFDLSFRDSVGMVFQTFPSTITRFRFEMEENQMVASNSYVKGQFLIPLISTEKKFSFTVPLNNLGFQDGYLDDVVDTRFTFNSGAGDQEIKVTVKRAVLSGYEKIAMTIDLEWPSLGVTLTDLRGFNVWGDYAIGFDNKNGTIPLTERHNASLSGYPITISVIGAAANDGNYVFATTADAGLGDDVSGGEGEPSINIYSVMANAYVPLGASGQVVANTTQQIPFGQASANATKDFSQLEQGLVSSLESDQEQIISAAEDLKNSLAGASGIQFLPEEIVGMDSTAGPSEIGYGTQPREDSRFNSRQQEIIYEIAAGFVEEMAKPLIAPLKNKTDSISLAVERKINALVDTVGIQVRIRVYTLVEAIINQVAEKLENDKIDVSSRLLEQKDAITDRITGEIIASLRLTAQNNIIEPVKILLKDKITGRINKHITENGTEAVYAAITGNGGDATDALRQIIAGAPDILGDIVKDVAAFVSIDNIRSTIEATATDFVKNINVSAIGHDLRKIGEDILKDAVNEAIGKAVSALAAKYAEDVGLAGFGIGGENPIDFVGVAQRFKDGGIKGVFAIDRVRVKLRTPVIDLDGFMSYTPKHPVYGDVWLGDIDMTIKVPKRFAFNAIYFNGRKDDISYWFCQITPPSEGGNKPYELGKPLAKTAKPLEEPVDIGIARIVGASGRLYHHMIETPGNGIVPDAEMRYGAYMHFVFFDKQNAGQNLRLEVSGEINTKENGDYTIAFDGNLQIRSAAPEVLEIDKNAVVQGTVIVRYNSAEEHFFGYAKVIVNKPGSLCAQASLLVDVKPGKWRIAIGTREERIIFVPGCAGWSPTGWLDLNQNIAELGLGIQYSGRAKSPDINLGIVKFNIMVDAGFAFGIVAAIQYNPTFALIKAGVWIDLWVNIVANYKFPLKDWKSIVLVEIYIRGDLVIIFNPPPTLLSGRLDGHVKVICFSFDFKAEMKKEL